MLTIDEDLSWKAHIHEISKIVSSIGALKRVWLFIDVSMPTAVKTYKGFIEQHYENCSAVWDGFL